MGRHYDFELAINRNNMMRVGLTVGLAVIYHRPHFSQSLVTTLCHDYRQTGRNRQEDMDSLAAATCNEC